MTTTHSRRPLVGRFQGKVALVTGGTNGIGYAIALELLREVAQVVVSGLPADGAEGEHAFAAAGFTPFVVTGDLASEAFCDELVAAVLARHGRLDYLVNNAFSFIAKGLDATREDFLRSLSVGPIAFARLIQLVAEPMKRVGGGAGVGTACPHAQRFAERLRAAPVAQVSKPAVSPISKSAEATAFRARAKRRGDAGGRNARGFGNPRYSRLGSLRYTGAVRGCVAGVGTACPHAQRFAERLRAAPVAQVSKPAVSPISKSAGAAGFRARAKRRSVVGGRTARGFGNPRYSRLGSLRYTAAVRSCAAFHPHGTSSPHSSISAP